MRLVCTKTNSNCSGDIMKHGDACMCQFHRAIYREAHANPERKLSTVWKKVDPADDWICTSRNGDAPSKCNAIEGSRTPAVYRLDDDDTMAGACEACAEANGVFVDAPAAAIKQPDTRPPGMTAKPVEQPRGPKIVGKYNDRSSSVPCSWSDGSHQHLTLLANLAREKPPARPVPKVRDIYRIPCDPDCDVGGDV